MIYVKGKKQKQEGQCPLSLVDYYENFLVIKDEDLNCTINIVIRNGILYCDYHALNEYTLDEKHAVCSHIEYAQTLPQLNKFKRNGRLQ
ncbi:MAG TPA: hypothetical protein VN704_02185 [Verrucomicrobiae bacterium]|nr:hypothetical protein [Verrucomicrobiae bacterium]